MDLPFTRAQFLAVFADYNTAVWPAQAVLTGLAVLALLALAGRRDPTRWVLALLAGLWLWMGLVYHWAFFRRINPAATVFAALFVGQAGVLAAAAWRGPAGRLRPASDLPGILGVVTVAYAVLGYPLLGLAFGEHYPAVPTFGLPCPTTLFTIGVLLWLRPFRLRLLAIPVLWAVIGFSAAFKLGIYQDTGLPIAALAAVTVWLHARRASRPAMPAGSSGAGAAAH